MRMSLSCGTVNPTTSRGGFNLQRSRRGAVTLGRRRHEARIRWACALCVGSVVLLLLTANASAEAGTAQEVEAEASVPLSCPVGFGGDAIFHAVPSSHINDGYCDCPTTGADEPLTNACAGFENWSGLGDLAQAAEQVDLPMFACPGQPKLRLSLSKVHDGICDCCSGADEAEGECEDDCERLLAQERAERRALQESYAAGSKQRTKALEEFVRRQSEAQAQLAQHQLELQQLDDRLRQQQGNLHKYKLRYARHRRSIASETSLQIATAGSPVGSSNDLRGLLEPLSASELVWFVVHACQLAGEMTGVPDAVKSCLPLRLAALDRGMVWRHLSYELVRVAPPRGEPSSLDELEGLVADLIYHNSQHPDDATSIIYNEHGWSKHKPKPSDDQDHAKDTKGARNRKRVPRESNDDDDEVPSYSNDEDDDFSYDATDDIDPGSRHASSHSAWRSKPQTSSKGGDGTAWSDSRDGDADEATVVKRVVDSKPVVDSVKQQPLSQSRNAFLDRSGPLLEQMQAILDDLQKKEEEERKSEQEKRRLEMEERRRKRKEAQEGGDKKPVDVTDAASAVVSEEGTVELATDDAADAEASTTNFDPLALPLARDKLSALKSRVQKGFQYAVSAKILLDILLESYDTALMDEQRREALLREDLFQLALGTVAHGKLSSLQLWQIYLHVVPGLMEPIDGRVSDSKLDSKTCVTPWASSCPPKSVDRTIADERVLKIPPKMILQAAEAFCAVQYDLTAAGASACASSALLAEGASIPTDIPDGFLGYYEVRPREVDDPLHQPLQPLALIVQGDNRQELDGLLAEESGIKAERKALQQKIKELKESVGLDKPGKYGSDGELFALQNDCYSYDTGKYIYEVCLFGSAKQKEGQGSGGTNLGSWAEPTFDEESGKRVWKWLNGNRCWNGPNRSATAFITCGTTTRILSVEEPEICKYELHMESYIACDEAFRNEHSLQ